MKKKLALVIAALMITSMALSISTTTVSASATLEPTSTRADTRIKLTVVVTNETSDNIDNVRIMAPSGSGFAQAIGGVRTAENLKLAADNLENAVAPLKRAGENLKLAADNTGDDAGPAVSSAGTSLQSAAIRAAILVMENEVATSIEDAGLALEEAGDAMELASENFTLIVSKLNEVATKLHSAAGNAVAGENMMAYNDAAAENLDNAAAKIGEAATALEGGSLRRAGENLKIAGDNLENAGTGLGGAAGTDFTSAGTSLRDAGQALIDAAQYDNLAGVNLGTAAAYLQSAGSYIELADTTDLGAAGDNLENAASDAAGSIAAAGDNLTPATDNVLAAGDALSSAATYLATAATELGIALGGDELEDAMGHENAAAENLNVEDVDLGTAGQQLIDAADDLSAAATSLLATANALAPATWNLSDGTDFVQFNAILDNVITPGSSETFVFLWTTPADTTEKTYTIAISSNKEGGGAAHWIIQDTITLTVDGAVPTLTIVVTQAGVVDKDGDAVSNLVGTALDGAKATITITASEKLQSIGTVTVENSGNDENLVPPITLTTTDDIVYTGTFTVGAWDDNDVVVKVASVKDLAGIENTNMENTVTVDTRAPIFVPSENSGLSTLVSNMGSKTQAGTDTTFTYVDNKTTQSIIIRVEDNIDSADNDVLVISVTVNTTSATRSAVVENLWSVDPLTLSEGLTSVLTVTATDRTGNTVSDNVENIFIDTAAPTIAFNTIAGKTWTSDIRINDSTPEIKVTVNDPGYSASGLGIARENLVVRLDNDDNFLNDSPYAAWGTLENKGVWDFGLAGVFENIIENAGAGLLEGTYWVTVVASDNLAHDGEENQYDALSFIIDVTAPTVPSPTAAVNPLSDTTVSIPYVQKSTTLILSGTGAEVDATLSVYINDATTAATTTTVDSAGRWTVNISLTAGTTTKVEVTLTDVAGNEGARRLYGYVMADGTAPTVTLTTLPETTDKSSITISGTVSKDSWEDWSDITLTVQVGVGRVTVPIGAGGSYSYSLALSEGPNTIVVQASDGIGNASVAATSTVERVVTPWSIYAIILVIVALILAAIAIFGGPRIWKR